MYKKRWGKKNASGIEMRNNRRVCFFCNVEVKEPEVECQAVKWTIRNEEEVAYCHMGKHNHDLGTLESKEDKEAHQMQVRIYLFKKSFKHFILKVSLGWSVDAHHK